LRAFFDADGCPFIYRRSPQRIQMLGYKGPEDWVLKYVYLCPPAFCLISHLLRTPLLAYSFATSLNVKPCHYRLMPLWKHFLQYFIICLLYTQMTNNHKLMSFNQNQHPREEPHRVSHFSSFNVVFSIFRYSIIKSNVQTSFFHFVLFFVSFDSIIIFSVFLTSFPHR
jgi:hypothetical protein